MIYFKPPLMAYGSPLADRRGVLTSIGVFPFGFCDLYSTYIHCCDDALVGEGVLVIMIAVNK